MCPLVEAILSPSPFRGACDPRPIIVLIPRFWNLRVHPGERLSCACELDDVIKIDAEVKEGKDSKMASEFIVAPELRAGRG